MLGELEGEAEAVRRAREGLTLLLTDEVSLLLTVLVAVLMRSVVVGVEEELKERVCVPVEDEDRVPEAVEDQENLLIVEVGLIDAVAVELGVVEKELNCTTRRALLPLSATNTLAPSESRANP